MKTQTKNQKRNCILCGKTFTEYPNSPWPLSDEGECCNECDNTLVTPERMIRLGVSPDVAMRLGLIIHQACEEARKQMKRIAAPRHTLD
jgi:hypothetical protein